MRGEGGGKPDSLGEEMDCERVWVVVRQGEIMHSLGDE